MGDEPELPEQPESKPTTSDDRANKRAGTLMIIGTWVVFLGLLTWFAQRWYENNFNPNQSVATESHGGRQSVSLQANRNGHYVAAGTINTEEVVFMLDTGATGVSVPKQVATRLNLQPEGEAIVVTANGRIVVNRVKLNSVAVGDLVLHDVAGHINPHMGGEEVLLGMSYLRHFELLQKGNQLTLSQP